MSPKFSLGVALGFAATVILKNKPHRQAMRSSPPADAIPENGPFDAFGSRLAAIEADLDESDRVILEQSKAAATRAFRPSKAVSPAALSARLAQNERKSAAARREIEAFVVAAQRATAACREPLEAWINELPARVAENLKGLSHEETSADGPKLQLPALPEHDPAAAQPSDGRGGLAPRLVHQAGEIADLAGKAVALRNQMGF